MTDQERLDALRSELRSTLAKAHGLTPDMVEAVPLASADQMEKQVKGLSAILRTAEAAASKDLPPKTEHGAGSRGSGSKKLTGAQAYISRTYTRPDRRTKQ